MTKNQTVELILNGVMVLKEEIEWKSFDLKGSKFYSAVVGMAVAGNETQVIVANDINVIKAVAWIHADGTFSWLNPPDHFKNEIEKKLLELYPR